MTIDDLMKSTDHRPWGLPKGRWRYYQEWNGALFLHWKVPFPELAANIPFAEWIDDLDGHCWISLVAFTMNRIRPRGLPAVSLVSDFHEINVRTYLKKDGKPGVYFLNIEAQKELSAVLARKMSGLRYEKSLIYRDHTFGELGYHAQNENKGFRLDASFRTGNVVPYKSLLDIWLTERYCLYLDRGQRLYRYEIHHLPWELREVELISLKTDYRIGGISLDRKPDVAHYSDGVKVLAWSAVQEITTSTKAPKNR